MIVGLTYDGPVYNGPIYNDNGQTKYFSLQSLLSLPKLSSKCVIDQFRTALGKRPKIEPELVCINYQPGKQEWLGCTRLATFFEMRIEFTRFALLVVYTKPYKAITFLWVNIKPIKPTISTSKTHQKVYKVFQDHQKAAAYLTNW